MGIKTKISYCDSSVNSIMGCTGCVLRKDHCYAAVLCTRYAGRKGWPKSFDQPEFFPGRLEKAIRWKDLTGTERPDKPWLNGRPRTIFVNDMSDGFCPDVDAWGWLLPHLDAMERSPHTWLLLTKWPGRMREFFGSLGGAPDNFWLGTSVLRQSDEWRVRELLQIKANVHWMSGEPLLELIDLRDYLGTGTLLAQDYLDWVIVGGESGPGARPMHPDWVRDIRDQCQVADTDFFFKGWGAWAHIPADTRHPLPQQLHWWPDRNLMGRVGKKRAGRRLDGRTWDELPTLQD